MADRLTFEARNNDLHRRFSVLAFDKNMSKQEILESIVLNYVEKEEKKLKRRVK